jgi:HAD superfamily 5'-nucleotidase-like hydrolase
MLRAIQTSRRFSSEAAKTPLNISDYDAVGFDLCNTLCNFRICELAEEVYFSLAQYLIEKKHYDKTVLGNPLSYAGKDFTQRGLIFDVARGNVLKVLEDGVIDKASHGTMQMSTDMIRATYGRKRRWPPTDGIVKDVKTLWSRENFHTLFTSLNYFGMTSVMAWASAVRTVDDYMYHSLKYPRVAEDVLTGLDRVMMEVFTGGTQLFRTLRNRPERYLRPISQEVINWLGKLKRDKFVFLVSSTDVDVAKFLLSYSLGPEWESYFHVAAFEVRKRTFYSGSREAFFSSEKPLPTEALLGTKVLTRGSWSLLREVISKKTGKADPKCLFVGDDVIEDIVIPSLHARIDTVGIVKELQAEDDPDKECLTSQKWGPFLYEPSVNRHTLWGKIFNRFAITTVPSLLSLTKFKI